MMAQITFTKKFLDRLKRDTLGVLGELTEDQVAQVIQKANYEYYHGESGPVMTDAIFDMVKDYLEGLNPRHPILRAVGAAVTEGKKVTLPYFMGSLDKIKLEAGSGALDRFKAAYGGSYLLSDKLDGNSGMLADGRLYTRGDGTVGQDISHLLPFVRGIPADISLEVAVRGELILSRADFEAVKDQGANARNMVAGILNAKTPDLALAQRVRFVAYELVAPRVTPEEQFRRLANMGFEVVHHRRLTAAELTPDALSAMLEARRRNSPFECDGIVVYHNAVHPPNTEPTPKHAFAFKAVATMDRAEVTVSRVQWNLSKDGHYKPVVIFNPVKLAGVTVQKATGFNGKFIADNKIGPGARIVVMRSGDVIPYILETLEGAAAGEGQMPEGAYRWNATRVDIVAVAEEDDDVALELAKKNLIHFFEKIDLPGISKGTVTKLWDAGYTTVAEIFALTPADMRGVEGFQEKLAAKVHAALQEGKASLDTLKVMEASNTLGRGFAGKKLALITAAIPDILTAQRVPSAAELVAIKGIEAKTAEAFRANLPNFFQFLRDNGLEGALTAPPDNPEPLAHATLAETVAVFTGVRDKAVETFVEARGGRVGSGVNSKTTVLVVKELGGKATGKLATAKEMGIPVMTMDKFKIKIGYITS